VKKLTKIINLKLEYSLEDDLVPNTPTPKDQVLDTIFDDLQFADRITILNYEEKVENA
jgi:hypothetical protein